MAREIVLDTETTGLEALGGDRIVEIAAIELIDLCKTSREFHVYINPERDIPDSAFRVHGISFDMVKDKPKFHEIVDDFLAFVGADPIVAHNAEFDVRFLNMELERCARPALAAERVVDTLAIARKKFPGQSNSLDALCGRFGVDRSHRVKHGALIDADILGDVYLELCGGRQRAMVLQVQKEATAAIEQATLQTSRPEPLPPGLRPEELEAHEALLGKFKTTPLWRRYTDPAS
ncbi:MAG TPA: DNA polymerase III subunit epsilon [Rhodoblastus sp.]|nr:DNA polymerase III subunit epsilon [Rhodoblastus sp.]